MPNITVSLSCGWYDRTAPILDGRVKPEEFQFSILPPLRPGSPLGNPEADIYECSLTALILEHHKDTVVGLPIFPRRRFFHQSILVRGDSEVIGFEDFVGKKIGLRWYHYALGVWLRGYLMDQFDIAQHSADWFTENESVVPAHGAESVRVTNAPKGRTLVEMLSDRELDILVHEDSHRIIFEHPTLRRLFPDFKIVESAYFQDTGFFPINHLLVIKCQTIKQYPWIARSVVEVFEKAKRMCLNALESDTTLVSSPWMASLLEEQYGSLKKRDLLPYGLEPNRKELATYLRYFWQQGLSTKLIAVDELFAPML